MNLSFCDMIFHGNVIYKHRFNLQFIRFESVKIQQCNVNEYLKDAKTITSSPAEVFDSDLTNQWLMMRIINDLVVIE
jgi:hypothetical protein